MIETQMQNMIIYFHQITNYFSSEGIQFPNLPIDVLFKARIMVAKQFQITEYKAGLFIDTYLEAQYLDRPQITFVAEIHEALSKVKQSNTVVYTFEQLHNQLIQNQLDDNYKIFVETARCYGLPLIDIIKMYNQIFAAQSQQQRYSLSESNQHKINTFVYSLEQITNQKYESAEQAFSGVFFLTNEQYMQLESMLQKSDCFSRLKIQNVMLKLDALLDPPKIQFADLLAQDLQNEQTDDNALFLQQYLYINFGYLNFKQLLTIYKQNLVQPKIDNVSQARVFNALVSMIRPDADTNRYKQNSMQQLYKIDFKDQLYFDVFQEIQKMDLQQKINCLKYVAFQVQIHIVHVHNYIENLQKLIFQQWIPQPTDVSQQASILREFLDLQQVMNIPSNIHQNTGTEILTDIQLLNSFEKVVFIILLKILAQKTTSQQIIKYSTQYYYQRLIFLVAHKNKEKLETQILSLFSNQTAKTIISEYQLKFNIFFKQKQIKTDYSTHNAMIYLLNNLQNNNSVSRIFQKLYLKYDLGVSPQVQYQAMHSFVDQFLLNQVNISLNSQQCNIQQQLHILLNYSIYEMDKLDYVFADRRTCEKILKSKSETVQLKLMQKISQITLVSPHELLLFYLNDNKVDDSTIQNLAKDIQQYFSESYEAALQVCIDKNLCYSRAIVIKNIRDKYRIQYKNNFYCDVVENHFNAGLYEYWRLNANTVIKRYMCSYQRFFTFYNDNSDFNDCTVEQQIMVLQKVADAFDLNVFWLCMHFKLSTSSCRKLKIDLNNVEKLKQQLFALEHID